MQELLIEKLSNMIIKTVIFIILEDLNSNIDDVPICLLKFSQRFPSVWLTHSYTAIFTWMPEQDTGTQLAPQFPLTVKTKLLVSRGDFWIMDKKLTRVKRERPWTLLAWKIRKNIEFVTFRWKMPFAYFSCRISSQMLMSKVL